MKIPEIEQWTRELFPEWDTGELRLVPVEKGGSGRLFVRVFRSGEGSESLIAMHFTSERTDNARFASVSDFLAAQKVAVPRILARRENMGLLWMEDLGEKDLHALAEDDWEAVRRPRYEAALRSVFRIHLIREEDPPPDLPLLEPGFDERLYRWEQGYFFSHFASRFSRADDSTEATAIREGEPLHEIAADLAAEPRALVHRDFQSTNVMLRNGECCLIDYQGLRWGLPEYDVASLIHDPYCPFSPEQAEELARFYHGLKRSAGDGESWEGFNERLAKCSIQRLMQALGAYGFLGTVKGKKEFLAHIPVAAERLRRIAVEEGHLPELEPCLELSAAMT